MRWSARVSISRCTARPFTDGIRLGRRPGTALAVEGSQHKLGPLTFWSFHAATPRPMVNRALPSPPLGQALLGAAGAGASVALFMTAADRVSPPSPVRADVGRSPFVRLRELWSDIEPGKPPISLAVGEPQHGVPAFVARVIAAHIDEFGRYPMNRGLDDFCQAAASWLGRRFALPRPIDPASEILVLNGSREGLFLAAIAAARWVGDRRGRPAMLIPNPFSAAYAAGAVAANCEPVYLPAPAATGFLPDLDALSEELLARTVAFFIASPANPQGAVADLAYLTRVVALARRFGFLVFSDECYSEI